MQTTETHNDPLALQIVVIDDIKDNRRLFELSLKSIEKDLGFSVACSSFESAEEAEKHLGQSTCDLILCDERLGGMPGTDFFNRWRKMSTESPNTPFVIVSAKSEAKDWLHFFKSGVMDFIPKPISMDKLRFLARAAFRMKALRLELRMLKRRIGDLTARDTIKGESTS